MAEQRSYTGNFNNRWKFNGKELDEETGLYYYGARFYNPSTSIWLSVDPLAEKAPDWTPYRYAFNNPIRFIDPNGLYEYTVDGNGYIKCMDCDKKNKDNFDMLYTFEDYNNGKKNGLKVNDQKLLKSLSKIDENFIAKTMWGDKPGSWGTTNNKNDAYNVFLFVSKASSETHGTLGAEWALQEYTNNRFVIGTNHFSESVADLNKISGYNLMDLRIDYHTHPGYSPVDDFASGKKVYGDMGRASDIINKFKENKINSSNHPKFYILRPFNKIPYEAFKFEYNQYYDQINPRKVRKAKDL